MYLADRCSGVGTTPRGMASLHLPSPLTEKTEQSAGSGDVPVQCRQLSVHAWGKTAPARRKEEEERTILSIMISTRVTSVALTFSYVILGSFLVPVCTKRWKTENEEFSVGWATRGQAACSGGVSSEDTARMPESKEERCSKLEGKRWRKSGLWDGVSDAHGK